MSHYTSVPKFCRFHTLLKYTVCSIYRLFICEPWCWIKCSYYLSISSFLPPPVAHSVKGHLRSIMYFRVSCKALIGKSFSEVLHCQQNVFFFSFWLGGVFFFNSVWAQKAQIHSQHTETRRQRLRGQTDGSPGLFVMQIDVSQCDKCTVKWKTTKLFHPHQHSSTTTGLIAALSHEQRPD